MKLQHENSTTDVNNRKTKESLESRYLYNDYTMMVDGEWKHYFPYGGILFRSEGVMKSTTARAQLDFSKELGKHRIAVIGGSEIRKITNDYHNSKVFGYDHETLSHVMINEKNLKASYGDPDRINTWKRGNSRPKGFRNQWTHSRGFSDNRDVSFYANAAYTYNDKYSASFSGRVDQSNLFGADERFRYNPLFSAGLSWLISKEDFFNFEFVDFLKIRTTYGVNGNANKGVYPVLTGSKMLDGFSNKYRIYLNSPENKTLTWEKVKTLNIGVDYAMFKNRLSGSIEYYSKDSDDLIGRRKIDPTVGWSDVYMNYASMRNTGIELSLNAQLLRSKDFEVRLAGHFTYNKNNVKDVDKEASITTSKLYPSIGSSYGYAIKGRELGRVYSLRWAGLDENGEAMIYDSNDEKVGYMKRDWTDMESLKYEGTVIAPCYGTINPSIRYSNLTLSANIYYEFGNVMRMPQTNSDLIGESAVMASYNNRWKKTGDEKKTDIPGYEHRNPSYMMHYQSDINIDDASYVKLKDIIIDYQIHRKLLDKVGLKQASLKLQVRNLCYWAANKEGFDPNTIEKNSYMPAPLRRPNPTTFILGLNVNF